METEILFYKKGEFKDPWQRYVGHFNGMVGFGVVLSLLTLKFLDSSEWSIALPLVAVIFFILPLLDYHLPFNNPHMWFVEEIRLDAQKLFIRYYKWNKKIEREAPLSHFKISTCYSRGEGFVGIEISTGDYWHNDVILMYENGSWTKEEMLRLYLIFRIARGKPFRYWEEDFLTQAKEWNLI